jgi:hypothetical protein
MKDAPTEGARPVRDVPSSLAGGTPCQWFRACFSVFRSHRLNGHRTADSPVQHSHTANRSPDRRERRRAVGRTASGEPERPITPTEGRGTRGGADVVVRWAVGADVCGVLGCHRTTGLLAVLRARISGCYARITRKGGHHEWR